MNYFTDANSLVAIAVDCGYAERAGRVASYKKTDLYAAFAAGLPNGKP